MPIYLFLQEGKFDYDVLRKLAVKLEESGNKKENATSIVYTVNRIDDPRKEKYISWLTLSVRDNDMDFDKYFRLVKAIENFVYADLVYLSENVENVTIDSNNSHIDDFLANGMIYRIDGGFAYTDKAYDLVDLRVKSSIIKNNSSIWIYGIFKLAHLRKIQTPRKELFHV